MNTRKFSAVAALSAVLLVPAVSMADSPWVPANNNQGYRYQPDHGSTGTGTGAAGRSATGVSTPDAAGRASAATDATGTAATGKTREQVRNEYLNMSAAERQRLQELFRGP